MEKGFVMNPTAKKEIDNITHKYFVAEEKIMADLDKKVKTEVKERVNEGKQLNR